MARRGTQKTAEMIATLVDLGVRTLVADGLMDEAPARQAMREIAHNLARQYGGQYLYVPQDSEFALTKRDLEIYAELQGGNANALAKKHGISVQQVYAINRHVRDNIQRAKQRELPGLEQPKG